MNVFRRPLVLCFLLLIPRLATGQEGRWIATWTASPEAADADPNEPILNLNDQTVRERARVSIGGVQIRILLSNECSSTPLLVGQTSVALARDSASVDLGSIRSVTFGGHASIIISPGASALSDPINLSIKDGTEISISLYLPRHITATTWHELALKRAVISSHGDHTHDATIRGGTESESSAFLSAVLVPGQANQHVIVAFGDSIVDGDKSTPEADHNWPNELFRLLEKSHNKIQFAVVNAGIAGNRLLSNGPVASLGVSGLARFDRDALSVPGVTDIVLLEGINDIGFPGATLGDFLLAPVAEAPAAAKIIDGYQQMIARAHAHGIHVIGCTIMPTEGVTITGYHTEAKERVRQAVNNWIRTSHAFDAVIDFDAVVRDPDHPTRILPRFSSEDHLHPNDAGYQAMVDAIDLSIFM
jgi:lysophospholipase L1-like esterase